MGNLKKFISVIVIITTLIAAMPLAVNAGESLLEPPIMVPVVDIDLGDYQAEMSVGSSQLLYPTVLPLDATEQVVVFTSSNTAVATVNMIGRVTALSVGQTTINVTAEGVTRGFTLRVIPVPEVVDIDLGDFQAEMEVGTTQVLMPTPLPLGVSEQTITFESGNTNVATINLMGRVTAHRVGMTWVYVTAGGITRSFALSVVNPPPVIKVSDIEVANFKDEIGVGETVEISATALPTNAEEQRVTFSSANSRIATISSSGKIEGISAGTVTITARADGFAKSMRLTVKVPTSSIDVNNSFVVLEVGDTFRFDVSVRPTEADQTITFESYAPGIVSVSEEGVLTAERSGSGSILISTWDASRVVNVIVNEAQPDIHDTPEQEGLDSEPPPVVDEDDIVEKLRQLPENGELVVDGELFESISASALRELLGTDRTLVVSFPNYIIRINGLDIRNANNELSTIIEITEVDDGFEMLINEGNPLPGRISVELLGYVRLRFLHLYNESSGRYELISNDAQGDNLFVIEYSGRYLASESRISYSNVNWLIIGIVVAVLAVGGCIAYIAVKKRHWFW